MYHNQPGRGRPSRRFPQHYRQHSVPAIGGHAHGPSRLFSQHFQRRRFSQSSDTPHASLAKWKSEQNIFVDYSGPKIPSLKLPRAGLHTLYGWTDADNSNTTVHHRRRKSVLWDTLPRDTQLQTRSKVPLQFPSPFTRRKSKGDHEIVGQQQTFNKAKPGFAPNQLGQATETPEEQQELQWIEQWTPPPLSPTDEVFKNGKSLGTSEETSESETYGDMLPDTHAPNLEAGVNGVAAIPKDMEWSEKMEDDDRIAILESTVITTDDMEAPEELPSTKSIPELPEPAASVNGNMDLDQVEIDTPLSDMEKRPEISAGNEHFQPLAENDNVIISENNVSDQPMQSQTETKQDEVKPKEDASLKEDLDEKSPALKPEIPMTTEDTISSSSLDNDVTQDASASGDQEDEVNFPHTPLNSIKEEEAFAEIPIWADALKVQQHRVEYQKAVEYLKENQIPFDSSLPLLHNVILYFSDTSTAKAKNANSYSSTIRPMFLCETVWQFSSRWRKFKERFSSPSQMSPNQNLYFFKQGIEPMWEDPVNARGGRMTLSPTKMSLDEIWEVVLCAFVGGTCHNSVVGVVMSRRGRGDRIEIWMDEQGKDASDDVR